MTGRAEVARLQRQLDAAFKRIKDLDGAPELEIRSDFARYLCVLVSGYLEKAVAELVLAHAAANGGPSLQRFVEHRTRRFTNANTRTIQDLLGSFSPDWRVDMEAFLIDDLKDAVDSVVSLRHRIAHGGTVGVTYQRIAEYYRRIQMVVDHISTLCGLP